MNQISWALCATIAICVVGHIGASPLMKRNEATEARNYVKCVEDMQNNCEKARTPYEVLIQGPIGSRFVRSLLSDDSKVQKATDPKKRSTITIFKPDEKKEDVPAAEINPAQPEEAAKDEPAKPANKDEAATEEVKSNTEEKAKRDVEKAEAKEDAATQTDADKKSEAEQTPEEPKKDDAADKPSEADKEKKMTKRDAGTDIESALDELAKGSETDVAKSETDSKKKDETNEPTVGLALPGLLGIKPIVPILPGLAALKAQIGIKKAVTNAKVAAMKAKANAGLAGLGLPLLPIV